MTIEKRKSDVMTLAIQSSREFDDIEEIVTRLFGQLKNKTEFVLLRKFSVMDEFLEKHNVNKESFLDLGSGDGLLLRWSCNHFEKSVGVTNSFYAGTRARTYPRALCE